MAVAYYRDPGTGNPVQIWITDIDLQTANGLYVAKAGSTMTGDLIISRMHPWLILDSVTPSERYVRFRTNGKDRWTFGAVPGTESGGNSGSDFSIARWADDGAWIDNPIGIIRSSGLVYTNALTTYGNVTHTQFVSVQQTPTDPSHAARKDYVDSKMTTHEAAADPHTGYQRETEKSAVNGYAALDGTTKVPIAQIPTGTTGTTVALGNHAHAGVYDPAGTASSAVSTHAAAADPHTGYQLETEKSAANGYAALDASIKVPIAQVPTGTSGTTVSLGNHNHDTVYLKLAGGTLTGPLILAADPATALGAATRQYVDNKPSGVNRSITSISGNTSASGTAMTDYTYICTALLTLTLPTAVGNTNSYTVKRTGTGNITINTSASQTIDGAANFTLDTQYQSINLISDGANWVVVSEYWPRTAGDARYVTKSGNSTISGNLTVTGTMQAATITEA